ncbi:MAG: hypothetical protein JXB26_09195 [Candidatus Aminicenantes bacterium]|nr:hypothetical protein [Candidatus Aminicenantes bacterium]
MTVSRQGEFRKKNMNPGGKAAGRTLLRETKGIFYYSAFILLFLLIIIELAAILWLNQGHLIFTLDDAYIHLSLAENIKEGHYGINKNEFSTPSSSIIWPFFLVPFAPLKSAGAFILILNVLFAFLSMILIYRILELFFRFWEGREKNLFIGFIAMLCIPAMNIIGLVFTGMEHSLQLVFALLVILGVIWDIQKDQVTWWFLSAVVAGPLVRYENLALSMPVLVFLILRKRHKKALVCFILMAILVGGFSLFLSREGHSFFPDSVRLKSSVASLKLEPATIIGGLNRSLRDGRGFVIFLGSFPLLLWMLDSRIKLKERLVFGTVFLCVFLHLLFGRYGWYGRYEIYIWCVILITLVFGFRENIVHFVSGRKMLNVFVVFCLFIGYTCYPYVKILFTTPFGSNNIYQQQYQIHRFAVEYYKKPIAVNDLGWPSYRNDHYVLDLWGLGSREAFDRRMKEKDTDWMDALVRKYGVSVVVIYKEIFEGIPESWIPMAEMFLRNPRVTASKDTVTFYVTVEGEKEQVRSVLQRFSLSLPKGVKLKIE